MAEDPSSVPSPLPFAVSILPLLLASSDAALPPSALSSSTLQRHYYLSITPDTPIVYFQATSDASVQDAVEGRREALASSWLEDVKLSADNQIVYSRTFHDEGKLVARLIISNDVAASTSGAEQLALALLVVWEEAADSESGGEESHEEPRVRGGADNTRDESTWAFYDLQLPTSKINIDKVAWHATIDEANAALARLESASGRRRNTSDGKGERSSSSSANPYESEEVRRRMAEDKQRQLQESSRGLQGEEGVEQDPEDYWAGVDSSGDEGEESDAHAGEEQENEQSKENDYWASYGDDAVESSIPDSGDHPSESIDEDQTQRLDRARADTIRPGDHHPHHPSLQHMHAQERTYLFEPESGGAGEPLAQGHRILVENANGPLEATSERTTTNGNGHDPFLATLQSSLERVSSASPGDAEDHRNSASHRLNGYLGSNGHANGYQAEAERGVSPTFDQAIQKSIAGIWETYLISSASGGGGKNRDIAAFEFLELVRGVVEGGS